MGLALGRLRATSLPPLRSRKFCRPSALAHDSECLLGAIAGYAALTAAGGGAWVAALAAGLTMALTTVARTPQAAGCATAVVIVLQTPQPLRFVPLLLGSTILVLTGCAASRVRRGAPRYPAYWW